MPQVELVLLVGSYVQNYYLGRNKETLTERVRRWADFASRFVPLPHPSLCNILWLRGNPWFEAEVVSALRNRLGQLDG